METETKQEWVSPRKKEQLRKLANYAVFDAMMDAVDEGEFTRAEAIKSLESE